MSRTTGPILFIGAVTVANRTIVNDKPIDWRVPIATGIAAGMFALAEKAFPDVAVGLAWVAVVTVMFSRVDPSVPAPAESFVKWWNEP